MEKSPDAFRTISEVAEWLGTPTHVLRFWESRFTQVKPVKRAGGRRYYRPADMELLGGIKKLLHDDGMTIRGVQKLLREEGVRHVAAMSAPINGDQSAPALEADAPMQSNAPQAPADNVVSMVDETGVAAKQQPADETQDDLFTERQTTEVKPAEEPSTAAEHDSKDVATAPEKGADEARLETADDAPSADATKPAPIPEPAPPRALGANIPADPDDSDETSDQGASLLAVLHAAGPALSADADKISPLYDRLKALRDKMAARAAE